MLPTEKPGRIRSNATGPGRGVPEPVKGEPRPDLADTRWAVGREPGDFAEQTGEARVRFKRQVNPHCD